MAKRNISWTAGNTERLNQVIDVLNELQEYWPLTLRQVYYQLVSKEYIKNHRQEYQKLSQIVKQARLDKYIPWEAIEDRNRALHSYSMYDTPADFIRKETANYLKGFSRDLQDRQGYYLEIWIEKDALATIFTRAAEEYSIPVAICKGYTSVTMLHSYIQRIKKPCLHKGRQPVILYFGDFDPSGVQMLQATKETLEQDMGRPGIIYHRAALNEEDIEQYNLPAAPDALKPQDPRARDFVNKYGNISVELDALHPEIIINKTKEAIQNFMDMELYQAVVLEQEQQSIQVQQLKRKVQQYLYQEGHLC